ncbi:MAG: anti-sigma factor family protein [Candidatus Aminicenantia bacterium]
MNCQYIEQLLNPYLEGELTSEEKLKVEKHLKVCSACKELLNSLGEVRKALSEWPELEVKEELIEKILVQTSKKEKIKPRFGFLFSPALHPAFALATAFLVLFSLYLLVPNKHAIYKEVNKRIHRGYSRIERLYTKTELVKDNISSYKDVLFSSINEKARLTSEEFKKYTSRKSKI